MSEKQPDAVKAMPERARASSRVLPPPEGWRTNEAERQALIATYLQLRALGANLPRQKTLLRQLEQFELGWPERADGRRHL